MKNFTGNCIILGHKNFGEADKLIYFYNEELGKIKAVAKGARRIKSRFTGHLETLNIVNCSLYFGPRNIILREIVTTENFAPLRRNLNSVASAMQIAEITNRIVFESQTLEHLFRLLEKTLLHLSKSSRPNLIALAYIIKLLDKAGLIPDFKTVHTKISPKYLKFLNYLKTEHLSQIERIKTTKIDDFQIKKIVKNLIERETEQQFNSFFA
ncbi:MAG: DNA repair protein RecO [Candidatus Gracilibacteria bacterium]